MPVLRELVGGMDSCQARALLLMGALMLLVGCAGSAGGSGRAASPAPVASKAPLPANHGRYSLSQDRAPSRPLDASLIREVVPVPLNRTMAGNRSPYTVNGQTYRVMASEEGYREVGLASWYGEKFHGHRTSNGEVFDMYQVSAAHKALPIPSFATVTNLDNGRSIVVRVNDRGPFHSDRIIDLSYAAAWQLGFADSGTARVEVKALVPAGTARPTMTAQAAAPQPALVAAEGSGNFLQVGAFSDMQAARRLTDQVRTLTSRPVFIRTVQGSANQVLHRVRVGPIADPHEMDRLTALVVDADLGRPYTVVD